MTAALALDHLVVAARTLDEGVAWCEATLAAQRETALGVLRWRISVRSDGARLFDGALPTLIEWSGVHRTDAMPPSGVLLERLAVAGLPAAAWPPGTVAGVETADAASPLVATLATPRGRVILQAAVLGDRDVQP